MSDFSVDIDALHEAQKGTLPDVLGIQITELSKERVVATMPVERKTHQPFGLLHGGASVVLAESLASIGAWLNVAELNQNVVGLEINANHLRSMRSGILTGVATPIHRGKKTHVWEIKMSNEQGELVCISRCTIAILEPR